MYQSSPPGGKVEVESIVVSIIAARAKLRASVSPTQVKICTPASAKRTGETECAERKCGDRAG